MSDDRSYLTLDYMLSFRCKMGACRHACCVGWPISVSMHDYFRLLGEECSPELRRRIDCALHLHPRPTPEAYAQILPRWDGDCALRMPDGRCALQWELGERALAHVCRLYPRGVRQGEGTLECSCANSCEAVVEQLCRPEPLQVTTAALPVIPPPMGTRLHVFHTGGRETAIRLWLIRLMQDRRISLDQRLEQLGCAVQALDEAVARQDLARVDDLLSGREALPAPAGGSMDHHRLMAMLERTERMLSILDEQSDSIRAYGEEVLLYLGQGKEALERYEAATAHLEQLLPHWESWMENLLVNHMFFTRFPFQDRPVSFREEHIALCAVYMLLHLLCAGWMACREEPSAAMDVAAALFRLVDHTDFDRRAISLMQ